MDLTSDTPRGHRPVTVLVDEAPDFLRFNLTGAWPSVEEQCRLRQRLLANGQLTSATRALYDLRDLTRMPSLSDIEANVALARSTGGWPAKRAYLVKHGVQYRVARQMQTLEFPGVDVQLFTDEDLAIEWLWTVTTI